jgi:hypothetical protein
MIKTVWVVFIHYLCNILTPSLDNLVLKTVKATNYVEGWYRGCQISLDTTYQNWKNILNIHNIYQMATQYTKYP